MLKQSIRSNFRQLPVWVMTYIHDPSADAIHNWEFQVLTLAHTIVGFALGCHFDEEKFRTPDLSASVALPQDVELRLGYRSGAS